MMYFHGSFHVFMVVNCSWKFQLTIKTNFLSSKDTDEEHVMHLMSDSIEMMIYDKANAVTEEIFYSLFKGCQIGLEISMKDSDFIFDCVHFLYYKCY